MSGEIDVKGAAESPFKRLQEHKPSSGFKFTKLRMPEGRTQFGYRIKFLKDIEIIPNTRYPNEDGSPKMELVGTVAFAEVWNDDEIKKGLEARLNLSRHAVCERWFREKLSAVKNSENQVVGYESKDKEFDIMIQGKVRGGKGHYYTYAILPVEAELRIEGLIGVLFEGDGDLFAETTE